MDAASSFCEKAVHGQAVGAVLAVFILMFVGYGAKKIRVLKSEDAGILSTIVLYITLPAFVFDAIYNYHGVLSSGLLKVPIVGFAMEVVIGVAALFIGKALKFDRPTIGGFILVSAFGNTGFLGYPVIQAAFHDRSALITAVLYDEVAMALVLYTIGMVVAAKFAGESTDIWQFLKAACTPAVVIIPVALILRPYHNLPAPLVSAIKYMAEGTVPLAMITLGLYLSASSLKGMAAPLVVCCVLKLAALPVVTFFAAHFSGIHGTMLSSMTVEAATPSSVMTCVVAARYGANDRFVAGVIFATTLLSVATIPAALLLLGVSG